MSKFDWKKFAGGVLSGVAADVRERRLKADEYEEERVDLAKSNIPIYQKKRQLAASAAQFGHRARAMGASDAQIKNALSSGVNGIKEFHDKLQDTVNEKGVKKLGESDIEAIVNMPTIPDVDFKFVDNDYDEFVRKTYGLDVNPVEVEEKDPSFLRTIFALDSKDQAKRRLRDREIFEGMSVAEINAAVKAAEYESLFPESTMTFTNVNFFGKKDLRQFTRDLTTSMSTALKDPDSKARIEAAATEAMNEYNEGKSVQGNVEDGTLLDTVKSQEIYDEAEAIERGLVQSEAAELVIQNALDVYYLDDILQNESFQRLVEDSMGRAYLDKLLEENDLLEANEPDPIPYDDEQFAEEDAGNIEELLTAPEGGTDDSEQPPSPEGNQEETTEAEAPNTEDQKAALLAKTFPKRPSSLSAKRVGWDRDYKGMVDPKTGKVIIAPPRPADGGEKTKEIKVRAGGILNAPTGQKKMVTEAEYWDMTYGETHDPSTGLPIGYETLLED